MTTCVATLCEEGRAIVIASDRMLGTGFVESEPDVCKAFHIHPEWWLMFAGDGIEPVTPIKDGATRALKPLEKTPSVEQVIKAVSDAYEAKRCADAELLCLKKHGWTLDQIIGEGKARLPDALLKEWYGHFADYELKGVELLVCGFDADGMGHIFSVESSDGGVPQQHDIGGYYAIGSGSVNALFIMAYSCLGPKKKLREALYYAYEGKFYGENAPSVGVDTDIYVLRPGVSEIKISEKSVDKTLTTICLALEPDELRLRDYNSLNSIEELKGLPLLELPKKKAARRGQVQLKETGSMDSVNRSVAYTGTVGEHLAVPRDSVEAKAEKGK